jgi:hypothetical protein
VRVTIRRSLSELGASKQAVAVCFAVVRVTVRGHAWPRQRHKTERAGRERLQKSMYASRVV